MTGAYAYTPTIWPPLVAAIVVAAMGLYAWHRREVPAVKPFVATLLFGCLWVLGVAAQAAAVSPAAKIAWNKYQFLFTVLAVTAGTCFYLEYAYPGRWLTRRNLILLSIVPLLTLILIVVDDARFIWQEFIVAPDGAIISHYAIPGAIVLAYSWGLVFVNAAVSIWLFVRSPQHRWPVAIMLVGQFAGRAAYLLNLTGAPPPAEIDPTTLAVAAIGTAYFIALFGFHIFDPLPAARRAVIEQMHAAVVVFDATWQVASLNSAAEKMLGIHDHAARGKTWQQLAPPGEPGLALPVGSIQAAGTEIELSEMTLGTGAGARHYAPALSDLRDFRGLLMGYLLMLRDVTEQRRAQAQILEQQRSLAVLKERERLARELHDELGQVLGYVRMQAQAVRELLGGQQTATADEFLAQLITVTQDAHDDVREYILGTKAGAGAQLGFLPALEAYLQQFTSRYGVRTELVAAPGLSSGDFEPMVQAQLQRIIQEALTNARKHGQALCVQVRFDRADSRALVTVQDDGVGFDPELQAVSEGGHFGLRFLQERAQEVGGRVTVVSSPGQGTRVEVEVPVTQSAGEGAPAPGGRG